MLVDNYEKYAAKIRNDFAKEVKETENDLINSKSKAEDLFYLCKFFHIISEKAMKTWNREDNLTFFMDSESLMPMPESVLKQMATKLFKIKHLNVLFELPISTGFFDFGLEPIFDTYDENRPIDLVMSDPDAWTACQNEIEEVLEKYLQR